MEKLEDILNSLESQGYRLTKARRALLSVLFQSRVPLSVPEILRRMKEDGVMVNKTTVYRELENLARLGAVQTIQLSDRKQHYELASREHHHHLVCIGCERVEEVDVEEKSILQEEESLRQKSGFAILRHSLEFFGLCKRCQS